MPRTSRVSSVTLVAGVEKQVAAADAKRACIRFSVDGSGPVYLRNDSLGNVASGIALALQSAPLELDSEYNGDGVNRDWWAYSPVGNAIVGIVDTLH